MRQLSASCTASRAPWLPSGLIAPPCEESVVVRTSVVYRTALVNKLTVSTADPASIQAVLVYLLHVAAYSQCCEGVSSIRYDRFYQSVATSAAPVTDLGFPRLSDYLPHRFTSRDNHAHVAAVEPLFPSPVLTGGTTLAVAASTIRSVDCFVFLDASTGTVHHGALGMMCQACRDFRNDTVGPLHSKNAREYEALAGKPAFVLPRVPGSRKMSSIAHLPDVRSPAQASHSPAAAEPPAQPPLMNIGRGNAAPLFAILPLKSF